MKKYFALLPILGTLVFIPIYFYCASFYPGGTFGELQSVGHNHFENFICDLLMDNSHSGAPMPLQSLMIFGMMFFTFSRFAFWYFIAIHAPALSQRDTRVMQCMAFISVGLGGFMFLPYHDLLVMTIIITGGGSYAAFFYGLVLSKKRLTALFTLLMIAPLYASALMWQFQRYADYAAMTQKFGLVSEMIFSAMLCVNAYRHLEQKS